MAPRQQQRDHQLGLQRLEIDSLHRRIAIYAGKLDGEWVG